MGFGHISTKPVVEVEYGMSFYSIQSKEEAKAFRLIFAFKFSKGESEALHLSFLLAFRFLKTRDLGNERNSLSISCG